jgi:hypothetical protein
MYKCFGETCHFHIQGIRTGLCVPDYTVSSPRMLLLGNFRLYIHMLHTYNQSHINCLQCVLKVTLLKMQVFWDTIPCHSYIHMLTHPRRPECCQHINHKLSKLCLQHCHCRTNFHRWTQLTFIQKWPKIGLVWLTPSHLWSL